MKSIHEASNCPLGSLKFLGAVQTRFSGLYIDQWDVQCGYLLWLCWSFPTSTDSLSVDQCFNAWTGRKSGNIRIISRMGLYFVQTRPFYFYQTENC